MDGALEGAVELLDRSLAYTRGALAGVRPDMVGRPTPCAGWSLGRLLEHMEDALDAFTEAATGHVQVDPVPPTLTRVDALREKACALLGAWTAHRPADHAVAVGDLALDAPLLVATAALEITVHGWDVAQATGSRRRIPDELALGLLPLAQHVIGQADRGRRFAPALPTRPAAGAEVRLLTWTGRAPSHTTAPVPGNSGEAATRRGRAS